MLLLLGLAAVSAAVPVPAGPPEAVDPSTVEQYAPAAQGQLMPAAESAPEEDLVAGRGETPVSAEGEGESLGASESYWGRRRYGGWGYGGWGGRGYGWGGRGYGGWGGYRGYGYGWGGRGYGGWGGYRRGWW